MKKWVFLVAFCLLLTGCSLLPDTSGGGEDVVTTTTTTTATTTTTTTTTTATTTTTTTSASSAFISEERALEIASSHWKIKSGDRDPKTGFMMTISPMELPTANNPEYRIALRWLVEVDGQVSHPSMLDSIRINAYTGDIVDPAALQPE